MVHDGDNVSQLILQNLSGFQLREIFLEMRMLFALFGKPAGSALVELTKLNLVFVERRRIP